MTCKDCIHSGLCYKENDFNNFPDKCGSFIGEFQNNDYANAYKEGYKQAIIDGKTNFSRPQGEWLFKEITDDYKIYGQCSLCKQRKRIDNFCSNCGADMRKRSNEE